eukprot:3412938-Amphidinium_carterae.1
MTAEKEIFAQGENTRTHRIASHRILHTSITFHWQFICACVFPHSHSWRVDKNFWIWQMTSVPPSVDCCSVALWGFLTVSTGIHPMYKKTSLSPSLDTAQFSVCGHSSA